MDDTGNGLSGRVDLYPEPVRGGFAAHRTIVPAARGGARQGTPLLFSCRLQRFSSAARAPAGQHGDMTSVDDADRDWCAGPRLCGGCARRRHARRGGDAARRSLSRRRRAGRRRARGGRHPRAPPSVALQASGHASGDLRIPAAGRAGDRAPARRARTRRGRCGPDGPRGPCMCRRAGGRPVRRRVADRGRLAARWLPARRGRPAFLLERALAEPPPQGRRAGARLLLGRALTLVGDRRAPELTAEALGAAAPDERPRMAAELVDALWLTGAAEAALALACQSESGAPPGLAAARAARDGARPAADVVRLARKGLEGATAFERCSRGRRTHRLRRVSGARRAPRFRRRPQPRRAAPGPSWP